jgi:hypothetical protein
MTDKKVARAYEALVAEGAIIDDAAQRRAVAALDEFGERVARALASTRFMTARFALQCPPRRRPRSSLRVPAISNGRRHGCAICKRKNTGNANAIKLTFW